MPDALKTPRVPGLSVFWRSEAAPEDKRGAVVLARTQVPSRGKPPMGRSNPERIRAYLMLHRNKSSPVASET
jgi:hypothetical protein